MSSQSLESQFFSVTFGYNVKLVEKLAGIIRSSNNEKRINSCKYLVFKMMKDVVKKNILNYIKLLSTIDDYPRENIPSEDDLIAECYLRFDKCISGYQCGKGSNFYFYFNKALSRDFFRSYTYELKRYNKVKFSDEETDFNGSKLSAAGGVETVDLLIDLLKFNEKEKRIIHSKLQEQKTVDFLRENPDFTISEYNLLLRNIKEKLQTTIDL